MGWKGGLPVAPPPIITATVTCLSILVKYDGKKVDFTKKTHYNRIVINFCIIFFFYTRGRYFIWSELNENIIKL